MAQRSFPDARRPHWPACALGLLATGCGPTSGEIGSAVLFAAPLIVLVVTGVLELLDRFWRQRLPELEPSNRRRYLPLGASAFLGLLSVAAPERPDPKLIGQAIAMLGLLYLGLCLIAWRIGIQRRSRDASFWAQVVIGALLLVPAVPLAFLGQSVDPLAGLYLLAAVAGLYGSPITALLLLGLLFEAWPTRRGE